MFIDTHCHINMMVKKSFDVLLKPDELEQAEEIVKKAAEAGVGTIINVGTSLPESANCVALTKFTGCYAAVGIHPNDCTDQWQQDLKEMKQRWLADDEQLLKHRIVGIGECGLDYHYEGYNTQRQKDAFKAQIELALETDLVLIVHTRDAAEETLRVLDEYRNEPLRGVIHCFSEGRFFADQCIERGFVLGIGGPLTYPKNEELRTVFSSIPLEKIVLETDAPFLPPQDMRGKQNHPAQTVAIAHFLADLRKNSLEKVSKTIQVTTKQLFRI